MDADAGMIRRRVEGAARAVSLLGRDAETACLLRIADVLRRCFASGGKVLTCGNGGSAAEALHLAEEFVGKYRRPRAPLPAVCLNADTTALTCIANDFGYERVFARQVEALGRPGDALVAFSTSGNSPNVVEALRTARERGVITVGMLGGAGGPAKALCDVALVIEETDPGHVQEAHQVAMHCLLEAFEPA